MVRNFYYILDGHQVIEEPDMLKWSKWFDSGSNRRIAETTYPDGVYISTVFLGLDHRFSGSSNAAPIVFETMIFGGEHDGYSDRCCTWEQAEEMHRIAMRKVNATVLTTEDIAAENADAAEEIGL